MLCNFGPDGLTKVRSGKQNSQSAYCVEEAQKGKRILAFVDCIKAFREQL